MPPDRRIVKRIKLKAPHNRQAGDAAADLDFTICIPNEISDILLKVECASLIDNGQAFFCAIAEFYLAP